MLTYQQQNEDRRSAFEHVHNCHKQFIGIHFSGVYTPRVIQSNLQLAGLLPTCSVLRRAQMPLHACRSIGGYVPPIFLDHASIHCAFHSDNALESPNVIFQTLLMLFMR